VSQAVEEGASGFPRLPPWLDRIAATALAMRSRWPHALLICGPEGVGKMALAMHLARSLLCETPAPDGSACGACASCRYAAAGQHPDLRLVRPVDVDDDGVETPAEFVKVAAIRALTEWAQVTSHRRIAKVAVIVPAETMNEAAASALLKTLEEPPENTSLVLVSHQPGSLFPTILSRCRRLVVPVPDAVEACAWLAAQGVAEPGSVLAQAGGAPLIARALSDERFVAERAAWLAALSRPEALSPIALAARIELGPREERRDRLAAAIDWLIAWTADLGRVASGGNAARNPDHAQALASLGARVARLPLFRYHRQVLEQRALLSRKLQPRLVAEALLVDYRALFS
jgi:DNA polymerase-3 subunit delta'